MPLRLTPLVSGKFYHVINRGVGSIPIFRNARDYKRFIETFEYYRYQNQPIKFSSYIHISRIKPKIILKYSESNKHLVKIICYCLMPNHYHFLLKQLEDNGISNFIRLTTNSYAKYYNTKNKRKGSLFEGRFKAVHIETENQLLHVHRYIHLNPHTSYLVKNIEDLLTYYYSSFPEYLNPNSKKICYKEPILFHFKNLNIYKKFITDHADYQHTLHLIKHKLLEDY